MACKCDECKALRGAKGLPAPEYGFRGYRPVRTDDRLDLVARVHGEARTRDISPFAVCKLLGVGIDAYNYARLIAAQNGVEMDDVSNQPATPAAEPDKAPSARSSSWTPEKRAAQAERMKALKAAGVFPTAKRPRDELLAAKREKMLRYVDKMRKLGFTVYLPGEQPAYNVNAPHSSEPPVDTVNEDLAEDEEEAGDEPDDNADTPEEEAPAAEGGNVRVYVVEGSVSDVAELLRSWSHAG